MKTVVINGIGLLLTTVSSIPAPDSACMTSVCLSQIKEVYDNFMESGV